MNISASSPTLFTPSTTASAGVVAAAPAPAAAAAAAVQDTAAASNEGSARAHGHRGHGNHGHLRQALNETLQGLGLSGVKGRNDHEDDGDGNVKHDIAQFMHALFQAVKGETAAAPAVAGAASGGAKGNFAAGLSALIADAGSGTVPQTLQDAFSKLAANFHLAPTPATPPATPPATSTATPADPVPAIGIPELPAASPAPISLAPATENADLVVAAGTASDTAPVSTTSIDVLATPAASPSAPSATTGTAASTQPALTLQTLLSRLQQSLGYGTRSGWSTPSTGNTLNLTA